MTVLTKLKVSKNEDEPALTQLVMGGEQVDSTAPPPSVSADCDEVDAEAARYRMLSQRARRINSSNLCACTALIAVLALCLLCGLFYYRHNRLFIQEQRVHAWCSLPYEGETNNDDLLQPSDSQLFREKAEALTKDLTPGWDKGDDLEMMPMFTEKFDINLSENTEDLFVPPFERGLGARFMTHFSLGEMVILPSDTRHCLTIELDQEDFLEPHALAAQVRRMENGETLPEALLVRRELLMVRSGQLERAGMSSFVLHACADRPAFAMQRRRVFKRAAGEDDEDQTSPIKLSVFGGRGLIQYTITGLPRLE